MTLASLTLDCILGLILVMGPPFLIAHILDQGDA
jgi:hypothetical protein